MSVRPTNSFELLVLKHRLKLEIQIPTFAKGTSARITMKRCKQLFPGVRTRAQALEAVLKALPEPEPGTPDPEPDA